MRTLWTILLVVVVLGTVLIGSAAAACRWEWDCSGGYPCRQVPLCDKAEELPGVQPQGISPLPPPFPPPSIRPVPAPTGPPVGMTQCRQAYLCDAQGQCAWRTVCR
jgi:hypothetical protein